MTSETESNKSPRPSWTLQELQNLRRIYGRWRKSSWWPSDRSSLQGCLYFLLEIHSGSSSNGVGIFGEYVSSKFVQIRLHGTELQPNSFRGMFVFFWSQYALHAQRTTWKSRGTYSPDPPDSTGSHEPSVETKTTGPGGAVFFCQIPWTARNMKSKEWQTSI